MRLLSWRGAVRGFRKKFLTGSKSSLFCSLNQPQRTRRSALLASQAKAISSASPVVNIFSTVQKAGFLQSLPDTFLGEDLFKDVSVDVGEAEVSAFEFVGETFVVDA